MGPWYHTYEKVKTIMCSRFFIRKENGKKRDVYPTSQAEVLCLKKGALVRLPQKWGFQAEGKTLIINARAETALEKPIFCESLLKRRMAVEAEGFYEWNREKEKQIFTLGEKKLYLAGFYRLEGEEWHFCLLTVPANESVSPVHDRMPLILRSDQVREWLENGARLQEFLKQKPEPLTREAPYEQLCLF